LRASAPSLSVHWGCLSRLESESDPWDAWLQPKGAGGMRRNLLRLALAAAALLLPTASAFLPPAVPQLQPAHGASLSGRQCGPQHTGAAVRMGPAGGGAHAPVAAAGGAAMQPRRQAFAISGMSSAPGALAGAAATGLWRRIQAFAMALVLVVSSNFFLAPAAVSAVTASGKSHLRQHMHGLRSEQASRKKLVLVGAGISATLHQVFDSLDSAQTGTISKDVC